MPLVQLIDETFLVVDPAVVAERLRRPELWHDWWPELRLTLVEDRGDVGLRWAVRGRLVGESEVWLEPFRDGVVLHYYLRADPTRRGSATQPVLARPRRLARLAQRTADRHARALKRRVFALKDELEVGRPPGAPRADHRGGGFSPAPRLPTTSA